MPKFQNKACLPEQKKAIGGVWPETCSIGFDKATRVQWLGVMRLELSSRIFSLAVAEQEECAGLIAPKIKAIANPKRMAILCILTGGGMSAIELRKALGLSQPTVSRSLKYLCAVGLVSRRRHGKMVVFSLSENVEPRVFDLLAVA